jgi:hypothetical protein
MEGFQDIGQRIVQAARLAVAVHLYESATQHTSPATGVVDAVSAAKRILQSRRWGDSSNRLIATGGAGQAGIVETPRLGDLVTDDERDGLMGRGDPGEP